MPAEWPWLLRLQQASSRTVLQEEVAILGFPKPQSSGPTAQVLRLGGQVLLGFGGLEGVQGSCPSIWTQESEGLL